MAASSDQLSVIKSEGTLVLPCEPTPTHTLPLSSLDKIAATTSFMNVFLVYKHSPEHPSEVIKLALAKALVPYYPLAGRLKWSEQGELTNVACTGDGVWVVEASSDCSLEDVIGWLELPPSRFPMDQLLPSSPPNPVGMSIMLQVTRLTRGGFVVGLKSDHSIADGIGIAQIMKAVAEIARGLEQPAVKPVWLRESFPNIWLPKIQLPPAISLEHLIIDVPQDHIDWVKGQFRELTGERCSTFDIVVAQLWQCRTRAINADPNTDFGLRIPADARSRMSHLFPDGTEGGYYGNCIYSLAVLATGGMMVGASIVEVVTLIKNAKKRSEEEFSKKAKSGAHGPVAMMPCYDVMTVSDWSKLGLYEVDYGWGGPVYMTPGPLPREQEGYFLPLCIVVNPPHPMKGRRLITRCVEKEHYEALYDQMVNFSTNMKL